MQQIVIKVEDGKYTLLLKLLRSLDYVRVVSKSGKENKNAQNPGYDFSDLAGKLTWRGDAVTEQRRMRDEW